MNATAALSIRLDAISKRYPDGTLAVDGLTMQVDAGELAVLVGPSGCGKSTILRMVNRLIEPSSGTMTLGGEDVTRVDPVLLRRRIGYVIQHVGLFPHHTVRDNIATVPRLLGWDRTRIGHRVDEMLDLVGLAPDTYAGRYPHELSGGQRQRVGVARALAGDPGVLLMDEPFSAVDPVTRARLQDEFRRLRTQVRTTILFVTHDVLEAVRLGDRIAVLSDGGRLEQYADPATVLGQPANEFVAQFVGDDRGITRLGVTAIPRDLPPLRDGTDVAGAQQAWIGVDATLRDALAGLLRSGADWIEVRDEHGRPVGALDAADIARLANGAAGC